LFKEEERISVLFLIALVSFPLPLKEEEAVRINDADVAAVVVAKEDGKKKNEEI